MSPIAGATQGREKNQPKFAFQLCSRAPARVVRWIGFSPHHHCAAPWSIAPRSTGGEYLTPSRVAMTSVTSTVVGAAITALRFNTTMPASR
jgi:hypothetical protein